MLSRCHGKLVWIALLVTPASAPAQFGVDWSRFDPTNRNSDVRKGLAEADRNARRGAADLEKYLRDRVRVVENWGSEQGYIAYRDHVIARNPGRGRSIERDSLHGRMIYPVLEKRLDIEAVRFHFGAYIPADMAAVTFGNNIYVDAEYRPNDPNQALLLAHELAHSMQFQRLGGEGQFARRYWGQIWEQVRRGNTDRHLIHDSMELEREAFAIEQLVGKRNHAGVQIFNRTNVDVHYLLQRRHNGDWEKFTVRPGRVYTHSTNFVNADDRPVYFRIRFDESFKEGYQEKRYALNPGYTFDSEKLELADGRDYRFDRDSGGLDLFQGKDSDSTAGGSQPKESSGSADSKRPDPGLDPTYGAISLRAGFTPDPYTKKMVAGGSLRTSLGGVNAHVARAPDFSVNYTAGRFPLTFRVESKSDTTLLINLPNGQWVADDDGAGNLNPRVHLPRPQSGRYDVWIGTFGPDNAPAVLKITELN